MATINATNRIASPAIRGESVMVTLNAAESASVLPVLAVGQAASVSSSSATGVIDFVDTFGHQFRVKPIAPNKQFNSGSGSAGIDTLSALELITITY